MKTLAETRAYLQEKIPTQLKALEKERLASLAILSAIALVSVVLVVFGVIQWLLKSEMLLLFAGIGTSVTVFVVHKILLKKYQQRFEKEAVPSFIRFIDPSMSMRPTEKKAQSLFQKGFSLPKLFVAQSPHKIRGQFDGLSYEISEVMFREQPNIPLHAFRGFFFHITLHEELQHPLFLIPQNIPSSLTRIFKESLPQKTKEINVDGKSQLQRHFSIRCTDEALAKRLLNEKTREQLLSLLREDLPYYFFAYQKRSLSIIIPKQANLFSPSLFIKANQPEYFEDMYKLLIRVNRLAEALLEAS